jgi:hypothetical protein
LSLVSSCRACCSGHGLAPSSIGMIADDC